MSKVIVVQVIYNNRQWIEPVFTAIFNQTFKDFKVVVVIAGNEDGSKELLLEKFPNVEVIDPGYNICFAKGHNLVFQKYPADCYQLVNPDMIMEPNYIEEILKAFEDEKVGGATGKLYRIANSEKRLESREEKILDTTGVVIKKSGRAFDRGQNEVDKGQYDTLLSVDAVSGAGAMYRRIALEAVSHRKNLVPEPVEGLNFDPFDLSSRADKSARYGAGKLSDQNFEFFDEDFHSYWEDVDLSWRMNNKGFKNVFVPKAVGYHARTAGSSKNGYLDVVGFIKHHRALPLRIRQLNYKNHILMYIKNSKWFYPQFFIREFFMFLYILLFETTTLKILPILFKQIPIIWEKRKYFYETR